MEKFIEDLPLFDNDGFANSQLIGYYLNQLTDRIFLSNMLKEKMEEKSKLASKLIGDSKLWINVLRDWEYLKISLEDTDCNETILEEMESGLKEIKSLLSETDQTNKLFDVGDMKAEELLSVLDKNCYVSHADDSTQRWGLIYKTPLGYVLSSLSLTEEPFNAKIITLQSFLEKCGNSIGNIIFLDLKWNEQVQTRIHIEMTESPEFQKSFTDRCLLGMEEPLLKGLPLSSVIVPESSDTEDVNRLTASVLKPNSKSDTLNTLYKRDNNSFYLGDKTKSYDDVLGVVTKGLGVLQIILFNDWANDVVIEETGMIVRVA